MHWPSDDLKIALHKLFHNMNEFFLTSESLYFCFWTFSFIYCTQHSAKANAGPPSVQIEPFIQNGKRSQANGLQSWFMPPFLSQL